MSSILAILFLLLGTFTQQTLGNGHGTVTFTIDDSQLVKKCEEGNKTAEVNMVEIKHKGENCGVPIKESKQFTVNWKDCPGVNGAADLKDVEFHIQYILFNPGGHAIGFPIPQAALNKHNDRELKQFFAGGKATITISANGRYNEVKYVDDTSASHGNPGPLTFTIDHSEYENKTMELMTVEIKGKNCKAPTIVSPTLNDSKQFTVNWKECPGVSGAADLKEIEFHIKCFIVHGHKNKMGDITVGLRKNTDEELKKFFAGGKATITFGADGSNNEVKYVADKPEPSETSRLEADFLKHLSALTKKFVPGSSSHSSKEGTVKFTVHFEHAEKEVKFESVEIFHQKEDKGCKTKIMKESSQFTVDWSKCEEKLEKAADLKEIEILVTFYHNRRQLHYPLYLKNHENELEKLFAGGEAKIIVNVLSKHMALEYVEVPKSISSSSHSSKEGTVKFTIHPQLTQQNAQFQSVEIFQNDEICETKKSLEFTVDWNNCPEKPKTADDLRKMEILITFAYGPNLRRKLDYPFILKDEKYKEDLLKKLFDGGEAKIVINNTDSNEHLAIEFVDNPNAISAAQPAGILAFNVDYENREGAFFDQVEIKSLNGAVDANCKPLLYEGGRKFSVNLANCGVKTAQDLPHLIFEIRYAPGSVVEKTFTRTASCYGQPAEELEKYFIGGEAKLVFFDPEKEKAMEFLKGKNVEKENPFFALTYLSAPNKPAAASSLSSERAGIELFVDRHLWQTEDKKKYHIVNGEYVFGHEELKIVDEQNMKLRKDGVECPLRVTHNRRRNDEFKFEIDWKECEPEIKSHQELEGMVLNITYQQGEKAAVRELHYQFTKSDSSRSLFIGHSELRLVEYEHGKVRNQKEVKQ